MLEKIKKTTTFLVSKIKDTPEIGMITGTGLGSIAEKMTIDIRLSYKDIPNFPVSTVEGHRGTLVAGRLAGRQIIVCDGRFHLYEGYSPLEVVFPVRVMSMLGVRYLLISSAAGGLNPQFESGDLMIITDHINLTGTNPLIGPNMDVFGIRFPDMSSVYDPRLISLAREAAVESRISIRQGIYAGLTGPSLETPAETRFLRIIGADSVGMSTVSESIAGVHCNLKIIGIVVVTNINLPDCMQKTSIEEIINTAETAGQRLAELWEKIISKLPVQGLGNK
ncbi:MAG: purine-nucleoside phosphorylase [Deltaproteobacteria bacterium]|nr:purine-nucleoside phosphorylase [Deltaproteobacteria bacterium]